MRARRFVGLIFAALAAFPILAACTPVPPPVRVEVWGDSIGQQSGSYINFFLAANHHATSRARTFPGTGICDWYADIRNETNRANRFGFHPQAAILIFSGVSFTPCTLRNGRKVTGQQLVNDYAADAQRAIAMFSAARIPVYFVSTPISRAEAAQGYVGMNPMGLMYSQLPARYPGGLVRFIDAGAAVLLNGHYTDTLPCLYFEKCTGRWPDGTRTVVVRQADGLHFCPTNVVVRNGFQVCPVQAPGAMRFAIAITGRVLRDFHIT
jgi:hypothetical protein